MKCPLCNGKTPIDFKHEIQVPTEREYGKIYWSKMSVFYCYDCEQYFASHVDFEDWRRTE